jgi:hypothetical protein
VSDGEPFSAELVVRRRNPVVLALAATPFAIAVGLIFASLATGGIYGAFAAHLTVLGFISTFWTWGQNPYPREGTQSISVDRGILHVGSDAIPVGSIDNAVVVPGSAFPRVLVDRRGPNLGPIEIVTRSVAHGRELLRAIGFDASQRTFKTKSVSWLRATRARWTLSVFGVVTSLFLAMLFSQMLGIPAVVAMGMILVPFMALASISTTIEIGADGIYLSWLRWKRFIPIKDIESAEVLVERTRNTQRVGVRLVLEGSEILALPLGTSWDPSRAQALV